MKQCVSRALASNPRVADSLDAADSASLSRRLAESEYTIQAQPNVNGGFRGGDRSNQQFQLLLSRKLLPTGTKLEVSAESDVYASVPQVSVPYFSEARVNLAQPVLSGWRRIETHERLDDADRKIESARNALQAARESLALDVVRAYYDVVKANQLGEVAQTALKRFGAVGQAAEARLALGTVSKMDVYRSEIQGARVKNSLVEQEASQAASIDTLKLLLGMDPTDPLEIIPRIQGPAQGATGTNTNAPSLEATALSKRPEVVEAQQVAADAERKLTLARLRLWPDFDVVGTYARQGTGESFDNSLDLNRTEWGVFFRSKVKLDRTAEQVAIAEADIALRRAQRSAQTVRAEVVSQVRQAIRQLDRATAGARLAAESLSQAEQQAELADVRYQKGVTDNFEVLESEEQLIQARATRLLSRIDEVIATAALERAAGILIESFDGRVSNTKADDPSATGAVQDAARVLP